ncbi:MAG: pilus assembly protein N-terminal domain-containing protein [Acidobacteria bacterium]|nr:pilus assembly protein N-terminal domain-containing protein [Acidobacteriota bacterium]
MTSLIRTRLLKKLPVPAAVAFACLAITGAVQAQSVEELRLTVGRSIVLDYPNDIRQISTSDPAVVDAIAVTTREILLHAKAAGSATVIIWSKTGQRTIYSITVEQNLEPLRRLLKETFPKETIQVQSTRDSLSLTGRVSTKDVADKVVAMVTPFAKSIVNNLQVAPAPVDKQIMLRVKFAELNRNASVALGANVVSTGALNTIGRVATGQFSPPQTSELRGGIPAGNSATANFTITDALNVFAFRPDINLAAFIRALQSQGLLQILAEPNLVTTNGKEAAFLVGGEFPVPVLQGGGNAGAVTIQFREFGIRLRFNPLLTENNTVKMFVQPEVSTIDLANAVTFSGFVIPALASRRMETNIELSEGQSFVIGGLIDDRLTETVQKIPGLANIPLLGALFRSREERKNRTELVVIVTPEVARPLNPGEPAPLPVMPREFLKPYAPSGASGEKRSQAEPASPAVKAGKKGAAKKESKS